MAVDQASDRATIWDEKTERFIANILWNEEEGEISAHAVNNDKNVLAVGEEAILKYFKQRHI